MSAFAVSQLLASVAFACGVIGFQCKGRRTILLWLACSAFANAAHFFVLERPEAGTLFIIMGTRSIAASISVHPRTMMTFMVLAVAGFLYTYESPVAILAITATLLATYASFQVDQKRIRLNYGMAAMIWIVHNALVKSPVATVMEATLLTSNTIGYFRHRAEKPSEVSEPDAERIG